MDINLDLEITTGCSSVLRDVSNKFRFTKSEFELIEKTLEWLENPNDNFDFRFCISLRGNNESMYLDFANQGDCFSISQTNVAYFEDSGRDTFTVYSFDIINGTIREEGRFSTWLENAESIISSYELDEDETEESITVSINEE